MVENDASWYNQMKDANELPVEYGKAGVCTRLAISDLVLSDQQGFGSVFIWYGSGSRVFMNKIGENLQLKKENKYFFYQKLQFTYPYASI